MKMKTITTFAAITAFVIAAIGVALAYAPLWIFSDSREPVPIWPILVIFGVVPFIVGVSLAYVSHKLLR
ncbi:MAG TPA: hypothetical protein VLG25_03240 [Patescibacteria group bacterium]|nr:hypothetical protein [Patescibacteria group bacterium]